VSTALALAGLFAAEEVLAAGLVAGPVAGSHQGSVKPFDARIHEARGQPGRSPWPRPCASC
jgi:histidine ammonia-lyase